MRVIDADAISYESIDSCDTGRHEHYYGTGIIAVRKEDIDAMPTIQPEPHWIPVTERLPEKSGEYLVTVKWVTGDCDVDVYEYDARHKTWNDGESAGGERAVAWCNLPEPYKGVTE